MHIAAGIVFFVFFLLLNALWIWGLVFWIMKIIEVAKIPEPQFRAAGTDKTVWVLLVVLLGFLGAVIWHFASRKKVLAAAGMVPPMMTMNQGGWYPDPTTGAIRWFDGYQWGPYANTPSPQQPGPPQIPPSPPMSQPSQQ